MKLVVPGLVVLSLAIGIAGFVVRETRVPERSVTNRPNQVVEPEYSSSNACRACHPSQYASWRASYHRTMTQVASPETVVADFDNVTVAHVHGRAMTLERRGREFWATFDDPDSVDTGATIATRSGAGRASLSGSPESEPARPRITRQVVMITGSHHQQIYW